MKPVIDNSPQSPATNTMARYGLREDSSGKINKTMRARLSDVSLQLPRPGYTWVVIPAEFDPMNQTVSSDGVVLDSENENFPPLLLD